MVEGPDTGGLWAIFPEGDNGESLSREAPVRTLRETFQPGTYYIGIGTSYQTVGNTGDYTFAVPHGPAQN